jgi:carotenoid cleavage dioxygenase-like enzyme
VAQPYDFAKCGPPAGGLFNCISHFRMDTKIESSWFAGPTCTIQEPSFIPREGGGEGEGWIIALLNHLDVLRNDIVILNAQDLPGGPVATIHLPLKLKLGLHGNFVSQVDIEECESSHLLPSSLNGDMLTFDHSCEKEKSRW